MFLASYFFRVIYQPLFLGISTPISIHAVGYGHRQDLGLYQTKQKSPGFKRPYTRLESVDGFQRLDNVALYTIREGKKIFVGL